MSGSATFVASGGGGLAPATLTRYSDARELLRAGDVVAFQGEGWISRWIMRLTGCNVSHIGIVRRDAPDGRVYLTESTTLNKAAPPGVFTSLLSDRLIAFQGDAWLLRLSDDARARFAQDGFDRMADSLDGKKYDELGVLGFFARRWLRLRVYPFRGRIFCSCLVAFCLQGAGVLPKSVYGRNESPGDLVAWRIYNPEVHQVAGVAVELKGFNRRAA